MSLVVNTPFGPVTSTSIQWVEVKEYDKPLFATTTKYERNGGGGPIILNMGGDNVLFGVFEGFQFAEGTGVGSEHGGYVYENMTTEVLPEAREIDFQSDRAKRGLTFFRFRNLNDPLSGELVDIENLAAHFGEGYALQDGFLAITHQPVEEGRAEALLPWLATYEDDIFLDRNVYDRGTLAPSAIISGFER
ncbi:hypothetical protein [Pseudosulfitobacter sp. SM2401]|uniref:hypothetical protein n=1 Tax=Pseudosulfitobacter sp. SM2401 TaxID=3350098 RepID=UPI0036F2C7D1